MTTPSFLSGVARSLDLMGQFDEDHDSPNGALADWLALLVDWRVVGTDLALAMDRAEKEGVRRQTPLDLSREPVP